MVTQFQFSPQIGRVCTNISITDDMEVEDLEVFEVSLSSTSDAIALSPESTIIIIVDNDRGT